MKRLIKLEISRYNNMLDSEVRKILNVDLENHFKDGIQILGLIKELKLERDRLFDFYSKEYSKNIYKDINKDKEVKVEPYMYKDMIWFI